jgi:hypothetical protein
MNKSYEVINLKTGKPVVRYESERTARHRYGGSQYKIVESDQPANAFCRFQRTIKNMALSVGPISASWHDQSQQ